MQFAQSSELATQPPVQRVTAGVSSAEAAEEWLTPGRFALLLGLLVLAMFPGVVLGWRSFVFRDFGLFSYPVACFQRESFWRGEVPLWNPYNHCGVPFLAQWNTLTLYPLSLIYLLLPLSWSLSFFCLAHLFWGGLGMYVLAHRWTGNRFAAALAGVVFAFNGLTLNFLMWPSHIATFGWFPWVLWLVPQAWREGGKKLVRATLAGAMQMLAGGPETILVTWVVLVLLFCGDWISQRESRKARVKRFVGMAVLVTLICSAQLLPFLQLLGHSQRNSDFGTIGSADWSMPLWGWANFLVPLFRTLPLSQGVYFQPEQFWTTSYYTGVGTALFGIVALRRARDRRVLLLAGLMALGLVLALGDRGLLYRGLRHFFPALGFVRYSVKFVILVVALAPLLAAFGFKTLACDTRRLGGFEWGCAAVLVLLLGIIGCFGWKFPISQDLKGIAVKNALQRAAFLLGSVMLLVGFLKTVGSRRILLGSLLLVVVWLDFVTHVPTQNPSARPFIYSPGWVQEARNWDSPPRLGESRALLASGAEALLRNHQLADFEQDYLLSRLALQYNCNLLEDVPSAFGFFSLVPPEVYHLNLLSLLDTNRDFPVLLDFMGVTQTTARNSLHDWTRRPNAMPLVTAGQRAACVNDATAVNALCQTNLELRGVVLLPPEAQGLISATQRVAAQVLSSRFDQQRISIQTDAPATTMVVVAQTYYPAWQARVDGKPVKLWRANYAFQALEIPAGRHTIELNYRDRAFLAGLVLSGAGLLACLVLWLRPRLS
jgi:hypothetical protein